MNDRPLTEIWVYLSASPLLWLTATLVCYLAALKVYRLGGESPLLNPVAITVAPRRFARCTAARPVAPDAPWMSTVSPACSRPRVTRQWYAVS
jgi:hypothetical protein